MEEKLKAEFKELEKVGFGVISTLYRGKYPDDPKVYGIKFYKAETDDLYDNYLNELLIQQGLSHSNVMPIHKYNCNKETREIYYTMPYLRSLRQVMNERKQKPEIREVINLLRDVTTALQHAKHTQNIAHNRIKPENIFCLEDMSSFLLAGWSGHLSIRKNEISSRKSIMKPLEPSRKTISAIYEAPEGKISLDALSKEKVNNFKADVYSLGIVMLEFCGIDQDRLAVINSSTGNDEYQKVLQSIEADLMSWHPYEKFVETLIKMVEKLSTDRPSAYEISLQLVILNGIIFETEKSEDTQGDETDSRTSLSQGQRKSETNESQSKTETTFESKPNQDVGQPEAAVGNKKVFYPLRKLVTRDEDMEVEDQPVERNLIYTPGVSRVGSFQSKDPEETGLTQKDVGTITRKLIKRKETLMQVNEMEETKEGEENLYISKRKLHQLPPKKSLNNKLVLMSKEDAIKAQEKQQKKSRFSHFFEAVGEGISDLGKKVGGEIGKIKFGKSPSNYFTESKKEVQEIKRESIKPQKSFGDSPQAKSPHDDQISPKIQMSNQLQVQRKSLTEDPRKSLMSAGDRGEIEFDVEDLEPNEDSKTKSDPHPGFPEKTQEKSIQLVHVFNAPIYSTSWSPNGKHVVTGSLDHSVRILDTETKECVGDVGYIHQDAVLCVAWSPDGGNIVSGSDDGSLKVFNFQMSNLSHSFDELYVGTVSSACWSPDGTLIASASSATIKIVDFFNKKAIHTFKNLHDDDINEVAWSKNGKYLASASSDNTVKIIDVESKEEYHTFKDFEGEAKALAWSRASTSIAVGSADLSLKVLDINKKEILCSFDEALAPITCVAWSNDGKYLASGSEDNFIRVYEYAKKILTIIIEQHKKPILSLSWSPDSENLLSSSRDCKLVLYNIKQKEVAHTWSGGFESTVSALGWSRNQQYVAAGSSKGILKVYETKNMGIELALERAHQGAIKCISWSHDGTSLATGSDDCSLAAHSLSDQKTIWTISHLHHADINTIDWSSDGKLIITGSNDLTLKIIDTKTRKVLHNLSAVHSEPIRSVAWSPNCKRFVSCSNDWCVNVTNMDTLKTENAYTELYWLSFASWGKDGNSIVSGSEGGTVKFYDLLNKKFKSEITTRPDSVDVVYGYSYSIDTGIIAALSVDPSIKVYDCNNKGLLFELQGQDLDRVCSLALSRDGKKLIIGLQDGSMRMYSLKY